MAHLVEKIIEQDTPEHARERYQIVLKVDNHKLNKDHAEITRLSLELQSRCAYREALLERCEADPESVTVEQLRAATRLILQTRAAIKEYLDKAGH